MDNIDITSFTYSTQPHSAPTKKYRNPAENEASLTLMSDPRVIRGSTLSLARKIAQSKAVQSKSQNSLPNKFEKDFYSSRNGRYQMPQPTYEFTVKPFSSEEIDVMQYLVSQNDYKIRKLTLDTQTDELLHRPDTPDYIPAKIGVDIGTQVEDVNELFDFNKEVKPILEVIVQKTLEQALFEVRSEEELKGLENAAREFRKLKFEDDDWVRKREQQSLQDNISRQKRIKELQKARDNEMKIRSNIAALSMMRQILPNMTEKLMDNLYDKGIWINHDKAAAKEQVIPQLLNKTNTYLNAHSSAQEVLNEIINGTERKYQSFPTYCEPGPVRSMSVVLTFKRISESEPNNDETQQINTANNDCTIMSVQVREDDSINSLDKRIRTEVRKLKKMASQVPENEENPENPDENTLNSSADIIDSTAAVIPTNSVLPDNTALEMLSQMLHDTFIQSLDNSTLPIKTIVYDGMLWNFPFPDTINLQINC